MVHLIVHEETYALQNMSIIRSILGRCGPYSKSNHCVKGVLNYGTLHMKYKAVKATSTVSCNKAFLLPLVASFRDLNLGLAQGLKMTWVLLKRAAMMKDLIRTFQSKNEHGRSHAVAM